MDTTATKRGEASSPTPRTNGADEPLLLSQPQESVEALEEAVSSAHQRLRQRMADEIEEQRQEAEKLRLECERARGEADAIVGQAKAAAEGITAEAKKTAERMTTEAEDAAARMLSQAHDTATSMLTRLRDQAGSLFASAAEEMETIQLAIVGIKSMAGADPVTSSASAESLVTRLIVRPNAGADIRALIRDRLDAALAVDGVKLGAAGDESFELLLIHQRDANVVDGLLAIAPEEIHLTSQTRGRIEIELTGLDWLEVPSGAGSEPG